MDDDFGTEIELHPIDPEIERQRAEQFRLFAEGKWTLPWPPGCNFNTGQPMIRRDDGKA